ncbi:EAL domain-containing protein [Conexibacter sp. JD483]|uniref:bifunctional diguanylate cyclase/phosphodiesterase n=1 Tax=unclassified Conexibacter TaxID=2627773 RepID=UPI00271DA647|nr:MULTISPECIES: EAL domain-containing protein [unclassified Conexibacter]MDO8189124.1 EAL domain-containing protein [Conexibacter sp. CPCC 205706]MDO8201889.1 EAL domain-containing protein [Conexibacter sp. CPCC 205762]MDR9371739.1 EAL domain-containing protein [Conexibacter sp. JD483]
MPRPRRAPLALLAVVLLAVATILGAFASARHERAQAEQRQREVRDRAETLLGATMRASAARMTDLATLMAVPGVDRTQFGIASQRLLDDSAFGAVWFMRRTPADLARNRPERYRLAYTATRVSGPPAGFDFARLPDYRAALGATMATGSVQALPPGPVPVAGWDAFVFMLPVVADGGPLARTAAQRREQTEGFVAGAFSTATIDAALSNLVPNDVPLSVTVDGQQLAGNGAGAHPMTVSFDAGGLQWAIAVGRPDPDLAVTWTILVAGAIVTFALGLLIWTASRRERYALGLVAERMQERDRAEAELRAAEQRHRLLADNSTDMILVFAPDGVVTYVSPASRELMGYEPEELVGHQPREFVHVEDRDDVIGARERVIEQGGTITVTSRIRHRDGRFIWIEARVRRVVDPETGAMREGQAIVRDVSERVAAEEALRESVERIAQAEQRFRTAFEAAPIGMALSDLDGRFLQVNDALCAITGYTREELEEMSFPELSHPSDTARDEEMMQTLLSGEKSTFWMEKRYVDVVGQVVWVAVHATLVRSADGSPLHFLGQIQDVSERVRYEAQLQHMADHDPLTGLLNRRSFERELNQHIHRVQRYGPEGAALVLDIDRFKHINDTLGHNVGDELIVKVAQTLRTRLRDSDVLARLGGDEFAVLLPRGGQEEAEAVAESILASVRAQSVLTTAGRRRPITTSIGIALFGESDGLSAEDVLVNADLAMYDAKEAGRDRAATFSTQERSASRMKARITWAERIREALEEDRFTLYAQPIVELSSGQVRQHELLLRMLDEQGEVIPPAAFIAIAERFDLMQEIDRWVVARAIRHMGEQRRAGRELVFEVNISGSSTGDPDLLRIIERELRENDVDPANLVLEVTETTAVANIPRAQEFASRLADLGCRFALDDFGAGFGSFYYLKHLPFDILKIDGEFVRSCTTSQTDQLLIRAAVEIARGMGKETIAEYVGDDATVELLRGLGVDFAQGFHIGRPAPLHERLAHDCVSS